MVVRAFIGSMGVMLALAMSPAQAATTGPATTRPAATMAASQPSVTPPPIAPSEVASKSESTLINLRSMKADLLADPTAKLIDDELPDTVSDIDRRLEETDRMLSAHSPLQTIRSFQSQWQSTHETLSAWRAKLQGTSKEFSRQIGGLAPMESDWQQTLAWTQQVHASPDIARGANNALTGIQRTRSELKDRQTQIWALERRIDAQDARVLEILASLQQASQQAFSQLLVRDSPPLWSSANAQESSWQWHEQSLRRQLTDLGSYLRHRAERLALHALLFVVLYSGLFWIRRRLTARAAGDPELASAMAAFQRPIATAAVLSFVASLWIYPDAPQLLWAVVAAAALVPAMLFLRHLIDRPLYGLLDVLVILFFFDQVRSILAAQPLLSRILFLAEMAGITAYLAVFHERFKGADHNVAASGKWLRPLRLTVRGAIVLFLFAFIANVVGYCALANLLGDATLASTYLAIILYAGTRIVRGLVVFAMRSWPLDRDRLVSRHHPLLLHRTELLIDWLAGLFWLYETLDFFSIRAPVMQWMLRLVAAKLTVGSLTLSLGHLLAFALTIWAAILISRFTRFVLHEDVFEHVRLPSGMPYAISQMLHYVILVCGFCIAVAALGYDMMQFTILAGAFGVGLGFGMQNIVNNFVSGIILLFERPIKVGDVVQMGDTTAVVRHIGIRASIMRTAEGSEIIVPNGNLLSDRVTNWTLATGESALIVPINLAPGRDPNTIIELLKSVAKSRPGILPVPAPDAYVTKFSADAFNFELRVWINRTENAAQIRSDLAIAIYSAAVQQGLTLK